MEIEGKVNESKLVRARLRHRSREMMTHCNISWAREDTVRAVEIKIKRIKNLILC
jgi:hypothetical protein